MKQESRKVSRKVKRVEKPLHEPRIKKYTEKFFWHNNHSQIKITRKAFDGAPYYIHFMQLPSPRCNFLPVRLAEWSKAPNLSFQWILR